MKKTIIVIFCVLVLAGLAFAIIPATRDEIHWRWALHKDETISYESYVKAWPQGRHAVEAKERYDQLGWAEAQSANTIEGFEQYVQLHGDGKHVSEANDSVDYFHWQNAFAANTIVSYRDYVAKHPQGKLASEANTKISALRLDQAPYLAALKTGTETSLKQFLTDFPGHEKEAEAQLVIKDITEGRDIVDLLKDKKIEIKSQGSGIQNVSLSVRRLVQYPLTVRIPVGTFFVSENTSAQNMVSTAETKITLDTNDWQEVSPDAACANRPRDIPDTEDKFTVQRSPQQAELAKLMPVLDKAGVDTQTKQAAVWIITDNADYEDLGTLVESQFGFGGSRVINEPEATQAMKICDEAGINITRKRIWNDKQTILSGLPDGDLKKWLQAKK